MSTHYVRDFDDALRAIEYIFKDKLEEALSDKDNEIKELKAEIEDLQAQVEELKEYKAMYEDLCA